MLGLLTAGVLHPQRVCAQAAKLSNTDPPEAHPLSCTRTNEHANQSFRSACNIPDGIPLLALSFGPTQRGHGEGPSVYGDRNIPGAVR